MKRFCKKILQLIARVGEKTVVIDIPGDLSWLKKYKIDTVIDIGANEGQFLEKIVQVFPNKQIYCFEPLRTVFESLQMKIKARQSIKAFQYAIGSENKETVINHCEFSPSSSLLEMADLHKNAFPFTKRSQKEAISVRRLDDIREIREKCKRPFIKVDTQGYELNVINGGIEIFKLSLVVMIEVSYKSLYNGQPLFHDIYKRLTDIGFIYIGNIEQLLDPLTMQPLQADAIFQNTKYES